MKLLVLASALLLSLNIFATTEEVSTAGKELHLTCVMNFTPFFIEIDETHTKAALHVNNRIDDQGIGHSREFITNMKIVAQAEDVLSFTLVFKPMARIKNLKAVLVSVPKQMSFYLGKANQEARIDLLDNTYLPGSCYVQFPPMAPQL
jgi:hypothetical protein